MARTLNNAERNAVWRQERAKEGKCQVQVWMDDTTRNRVDELRRQLGAKNRSEIINRALAAYLEGQTV